MLLTPSKLSLNQLISSPSTTTSSSHSDDDILDETYSFFNSSSQSSTSSDVHTINSESINSFKSVKQGQINSKLNYLRPPPEPSVNPPPAQRPRKIISLSPSDRSERPSRRSSLRSNNSDNAIHHLKRHSKKYNNPPNSVGNPQRCRNIFPSPDPPSRASFPLQPTSYASARPLQAAFQAPSTLLSKRSKPVNHSSIGASGSPAFMPHMPDTPAKPSSFAAKAKADMSQSLPAQQTKNRTSFFSKSAKRLSLNLALAANSPSKDEPSVDHNNSGRGRGRMAILRRSSALSLASNRTAASSDSDDSPNARKTNEDECPTPKNAFYDCALVCFIVYITTNKDPYTANTANSPTPSSKLATPTSKTSKITRRASQLFDRASNPLSSSPEPSIGSSPTSPRRASLFSSLRGSRDKTRSMSSFMKRRSSSKLSISSKAHRSSEEKEKENNNSISNSNSNKNHSDPTPPPQGRFEREFFIISQLGKGEFSEAFIACKRQDAYNGQMYAIKRGKPFEGGRDRLRQLNEPLTLSKLTPHPNIIKMNDYWEENNRLYIQTELCEKGSLNVFLDDYGTKFEKLEETRVWKILGDIAEVGGVSNLYKEQKLTLFNRAFVSSMLPVSGI